MSTTEFVYTTYIKTTPEKLWNAITNPEFTRQYWVEGIESDWKKGSRWQHQNIMGGTVLESNPPKQLVMTWEDLSETEEKHQLSRVTFDIEPMGELVRLNVMHANLVVGSVMAGKVAMGWPRVLSSLKSLMETGKALDTWACQDEIKATTNRIN